MRDAFEDAIQRAGRNQLRIRVPADKGLMQRLKGFHYHFKSEVFLQMEGRTEFRFPQEKFDLRPGNLCVLPPGLPHCEVVYPGEELAFTATVDDLRGRRAAARIDRVKVAPAAISFGIRGATVPLLKSAPALETTATVGVTLTLAVQAEGAGPLEYQWVRDGAEIPGATAATLVIPRCTPADAGRYFVLVRNRAGTTVSAETTVTIKPAGANG